MHGLIFTNLENFVSQNYGISQWHDILSDNGLHGKVYQNDQIYDSNEFANLINSISTKQKIDRDELLETFGCFMINTLINLYQSVIDPSWKTLDFVEHTQDKIRELLSGMPNSVYIEIKRISTTKLVINYTSPRRMSHLAIGALQGLAKFYHEEDHIEIGITRTAKGDRSKITVKYI